MLNLFRKFGQTRPHDNVKFRLLGKDGKLKRIFQPWRIVSWLIKQGLISPFHPKSFVFGRWATELSNANLVTNAGLAGAASRLNGAGSEAAFTYIALGTGTTAAAAGNTALETEITTNGGSRASATASRITETQTNDTARLVHTFEFTGALAITESGILNAASTGVLLARQVFSAINVGNGDSLQVTWDVTVEDATP